MSNLGQSYVRVYSEETRQSVFFILTVHDSDDPKNDLVTMLKLFFIG